MQQDAELTRLHVALEAERNELAALIARSQAPTPAAEETGGIPHIARMVAWEAAARAAQRQIAGLEERIGEVAAKRRMEAKLRLAMEDAFIEQQHHYAMKHMAANAVAREAKAWSCWCW